jgi:hypothetical protein
MSGVYDIILHFSCYNLKDFLFQNTKSNLRACFMTAIGIPILNDIDTFRRNLVWTACHWIGPVLVHFTPWRKQHLNVVVVEQHYCHRMELSSGQSCRLVLRNFRVQLSICRPDTMAEVYRCDSRKIVYLKTGQKILFLILKFAVLVIYF